MITRTVTGFDAIVIVVVGLYRRYTKL